MCEGERGSECVCVRVRERERGCVWMVDLDAVGGSLDSQPLRLEPEHLVAEHLRACGAAR